MNAWHDQRDGQWIESRAAGEPAASSTQWLLRQKEMVEKYRPDLVYFDDTGLPFGADRAGGGGALLQPGA